MTWQTSNATDVSIDGVGAVQASGSQSVTPADSTTYTPDRKRSGRDADGHGASDRELRHRRRRLRPRPPKKNCSHRT